MNLRQLIVTACGRPTSTALSTTLSTTLCAALMIAGLVAATPTTAHAQTFPTDDPVIRAIWDAGMGADSRVEWIAQRLLDSIGPRLSGSPGQRRAIEWAEATIASWGVPVEQHEYGTWQGWDRGYTHIDLTEPRVRTLNGTMLAWSPGTDGPVEGGVVALPNFDSLAEFQEWLPSVEGKFVALSAAEPTCRAPESWAALATEDSQARMTDLQNQTRRNAARALRNIGGVGGASRALENAGALGILRANWSRGWGANKIFSASTTKIPSVHLSCEDYGLVHRLASNNQGPRLRLDSQSEFLGEQPVANVIGTLRGSELPDEYVLLTAHMDSWDGASGATDNGTGSTIMLEAMRLLSEAYPNPRRTIVLALWSSEEQGLIGSTAYAEDHPEVVNNLQAAFNQDNGTWRIDFIRMQGYLGAGEHFGKWFSKIPQEITQHIELDIPGIPERGGSDHMSFICHGAAGFRLQSHYPDYRQYTWHTDIDTYDKIVFDDLRNNATLAAMLAYLASEDPGRVGTEQRVLPDGGAWPQCRPARRTSGN
jgi:carboxypeptidase Q